MIKPKANWCCKIGCEKQAEWQIWSTPETPDSYTETCTEHVGDLLTDSPEHKIYPLQATTSAQKDAENEYGWLIETTESYFPTPHYWHGADKFNPDHSKAVRFRRKEDAEMAMIGLGRSDIFAAEHKSATQPATPKDAEPDWWWCDIDPDESGDSPYEAMFHHRARLEPVELYSSYVGPKKWGVMHPAKDDEGEEATTFDTQEEAQAFCDSLKSTAPKAGEG